MLNWLKRIFFGAELDRLERYYLAVNLAEQYMTQFEPAKAALDYIKKAADNKISLVMISNIQLEVLAKQKNATFIPTQPFVAEAVSEGARLRWRNAGNGELQAANSVTHYAVLCTSYTSAGKLVRNVDLPDYIAKVLNNYECVEDLVYFLMRYIRRERYAKGDSATASHLADDVLKYLKDNGLLTYGNSRDLGATFLYDNDQRNKFFQPYRFKFQQGNPKYKNIS